MEKQNKLSIWLAKFEDEDQLDDYVECNYDDFDNQTSMFGADHNIDFFDPDTIESGFFETSLNLESNLRKFSASTSFVNEVSEKYRNTFEYNSIIILYNYEHEGKEKGSTSFFIGSFNFHY